MKIKMEDIVSAERVIGFEEKDKVKYFQFKISWKMTNWCNYRCPYCYMSKDVEKTHTQTPYENILKIARNIDKIIPEGRATELHLIGGEVCWYNLIEVLDQIKSKDLYRVIVATNFSAPLEYWQNLRKYCQSRRIQLLIIASFHLTQCDRDEFVEKAIAIHAKVKCVVNNKNIEEYKPYFERLKNTGCRIQPTVERDSFNSAKPLDVQNLEYVDKLNKDLEKNNIPYYKITLKDGSVKWFYSNISLINSIDLDDGTGEKGFDGENFYCTAGLDGARINYDGKLYRAGCGFCGNKQLSLGDMITGEICERPKYGVICKSRLYRTDVSGQPFDFKTRKNMKIVRKLCTAFNNTSMYRNFSKEIEEKVYKTYSEEMKMRIPTKEELEEYEKHKNDNK